LAAGGRLGFGSWQNPCEQSEQTSKVPVGWDTTGKKVCEQSVQTSKAPVGWDTTGKKVCEQSVQSEQSPSIPPFARLLALLAALGGDELVPVLTLLVCSLCSQPPPAQALVKPR